MTEMTEMTQTRHPVSLSMTVTEMTEMTHFRHLAPPPVTMTGMTGPPLGGPSRPSRGCALPFFVNHPSRKRQARECGAHNLWCVLAASRPEAA